MKDLTKEELVETIIKLEAEIEHRQCELEKKQSEFEKQHSDYEKLQKENLRLNENFEKLRRMLFGQSSEKRRFIEDADQLSFMARILNEAEAFARTQGKKNCKRFRFLAMQENQNELGKNYLHLFHPLKFCLIPMRKTVPVMPVEVKSDIWAKSMCVMRLKSFLRECM